MDNKLKKAYIEVLEEVCGTTAFTKSIKKCASAGIEEVNEALFRQHEDVLQRRARALHCKLFKIACDEIIGKMMEKNETELNEDEMYILEKIQDKRFKNYMYDGCLMHDSFKFIDLWNHGELAGEVAKKAGFPKEIWEAIYYHSHTQQLYYYDPFLKLFMDCDYISKIYPSYINCQTTSYDEKTTKRMVTKMRNKILKMRFWYNVSNNIYMEKLPLCMDILDTKLTLDGEEPIQYRMALNVINEAVSDKLFNLNTDEYQTFNRRCIRYISEKDYHSLVLHIHDICGVVGKDNLSSVLYQKAQFDSMIIGNKIREEKEFKRINDDEIKDLENAILLRIIFKFIDKNVNFKQTKLLIDLLKALGFKEKIYNGIKHFENGKTTDLLGNYLRQYL